MDGKMKASAAEVSMKTGNGECESKRGEKLPFRPASDYTKPTLQDPILRSDPIETEEALLRLLPFPPLKSIP